MSNKDYLIERKRRAEEYRHKYKLGTMLEPPSIGTLLGLSIKGERFLAPSTIDLRDYCVKTSDQGKLPWCAAYAAAGFASNILWRKLDFPPKIEPQPIYEYAKKIDGNPKSDGTSLDAVLSALLEFGYFDKSKCDIRILRNQEQVKYAIHKFGCCLLGMMVSNEWYYCNSKKSTISGKTQKTLLGGHAVLACGYTREGIIIQNSWSPDWASYGFALITWDEFDREFVYGAVLDNCLYDTKMR